MIKLVKIGGNVVEDEQLLTSFCRDFAALEGPKVLVHGGGVMASHMQEALGMKPVMIEGRRVTDAEALKTVTMVYAGWCNKHIVAKLQSLGCNAIGFAGCDASVITAEKRPPRLLSDGKTEVDYGYVGDVKPSSVNTTFIKSILDMNIVPVFCAINHDGRGNLLNTNADTMASCIAASLEAELICCFEKKGVLLDINDPSSVVSLINPQRYALLKEQGVIVAGMMPKMDNAFSALKAGAACAVVKHAEDLLDPEAGTRLCL